MEVFMRNVSWNVNSVDVARELAQMLHGDLYNRFNTSMLVNFRVDLLPGRRGSRPHSGLGKLLLPSVELGQSFLANHGGNPTQIPIYISGRMVRFALSKVQPTEQDRNLLEIQGKPYMDPEAVEHQRQVEAMLMSERVGVTCIQFGWDCRDDCFSAEWEEDVAIGSDLSFSDESREIRVTVPGSEVQRIIAIRFSNIASLSAGHDSTGCPVVAFSLRYPPTFEEKDTVLPEQSFADMFSGILALGKVFANEALAKRRRTSAFNEDHYASGAVAFTALALRLNCRNSSDLGTFQQLSRIAGLPLTSGIYPLVRRNLFSHDLQNKIAAWMKNQEDWFLACQVESLMHRRVVDLEELVRLLPHISQMLEERGSYYTRDFLAFFKGEAYNNWYSTDSEDAELETTEQFFQRCVAEYIPPKSRQAFESQEDTFECIHIDVTPTSYSIKGPFPERKNRVIRAYNEHRDCFVRVSFVDENELHFRFDRDMDGPSFIRKRVGDALQGIRVAGVYIEFLAYSQSALKEHAAWYVKPFWDLDRSLVNAERIRKGLGNFHNLEFDPNLGYCPARFGARLSQVFTATDSSIPVEADEIFTEEDINRNGWIFTDGVGRMSPDVASAITKSLYKRRRRRPLVNPRAFQVRIKGAKGMLSVDHSLEGQGRVVCLTRSMIKFDAPDESQIEIARIFDKPGRYYLNRPLIMLLEGVGIPYNVFEAFQTAAVQNAEQAAQSLNGATRLLESHGLGGSFRLPSAMTRLHNLGIEMEDEFYHGAMRFAVHHVLREIKHHARIPIPGAWTLVAIVDLEDYLEPREIIACLRCPDCRQDVHLEGPTLVSRSPTIHPGDVQVLTAVLPREDSPYRKNPIWNSVVFSTKGDRPIPSYLGGGDCDGDEMNCFSPSFKCKCSDRWEHLKPYSLIPPGPSREPADYTPAQKLLVDHPCTIDDVKNFFMEYIVNDVLGIVGLMWLIIADQSENHIFDHDCMTLAQIHSDAVDYPKSGRPVPLSAIPRLKHKAKPDWNAPETLMKKEGKYYPSQKAIGKLFRSVTLEAPGEIAKVRHRQRKQLRRANETRVEQLTEELNDEEYSDHDIVQVTVEEDIRRSEYIPLDEFAVDEVEQALHAMQSFTGRLTQICADHSLSQARGAMLSEQEVFIGTIVDKSSQPRKRKDLMSKMREVTSTLVHDIRDDFRGEDKDDREGWMRRAYVAWRVAIAEQDTFGAKSFWWIALGSLFDAKRSIDDAERYDWE